VVYDRAHHRELSRLGGLANTMPIYTGLSSVAFFANLGLPGLCGFIGEVMVLLGTFGAAKPGGILYEHFRAMGDSALHGYIAAVYTLAVIACFGMILTAGYMLWTIQRVFFGPERSEYKDFPEITPREITVLAPLAVMSIALGVMPTLFFFMFTNQTVAALKNLLTW
jgi:NADH-quinone oxidoreductase subunit M